MKTWQKLALLILIPAAMLAFGIWRINVARNQPVAVPQRNQGPRITQDETVMPRKLYIDSLQSARVLVGKPVWMKTGYEFDYFPYRANRVNFAYSSGVLASVQRLDIRQVITQKVPDSLASRIPHGSRQIFAVFTLPGDPQEYATAIGYLQGSDATLFCDQLFYYDDPHQLYNFWSANVWKAIDQHRPIVGMNELQTSMAVGVIQQSESSNIGNRTVDYVAGPLTWRVTFEDDKATAVQQLPPAKP
jgi:hypothetical protein